MRANRTAQTLWTVLDTMENTPGMSRMSATVVQMHELEKPGRLAIEASRSSWKATKVLGSARAVATVTIWMGDEALRTAQ